MKKPQLHRLIGAILIALGLAGVVLTIAGAIYDFTHFYVGFSTAQLYLKMFKEFVREYYYVRMLVYGAIGVAGAVIFKRSLIKTQSSM
jgi:hypothetical protein